MEEERVVGLAGQLGHGQRGGVREAVAVADHELLEGVLRVEPVAGSRAASGRRRAGRPALAGRRLPVARRRPRPRARARRARGRDAPQQREVALGDGGADVLGRPHVERAAVDRRPSSSGSSQMWNLKSGTSRRSSSRMCVPDRLELSRHGQLQPSSGAGSNCLPEEGTGGEIEARCPRRGRVYNGSGDRGGRHATRAGARASAKTPRVHSVADRGDLVPWPRAAHALAGPDEAHLPAQEAQARPHPRLPRPHEHPRGPAGAQAPPGQGPQAADALGRWPTARAASAAGCPAAASSIASTARAARTPAGTWSSTRSRARTTPTRPRLGRLGGPQARRRGRAQPRKAAAARGLLGARRGAPRRARLRDRGPPRGRRAGRARAASRRSRRRSREVLEEAGLAPGDEGSQ